MATASWSELGQTSAPAREQMDWMSSLNAPEDLAGSDQRVTPAYATTFPRWHPPTLVVAAEYDPLRDEAVDDAAKLAAAGVAATARTEPGLPHAFRNLGGVLPEGLRAFDAAVAEMNTEPGWRSTRFRHRTPGVVDRLFMARPGRGR